MKQYNMKDAFPEPTKQFHESVLKTLESLPEQKGKVIDMEKAGKIVAGATSTHRKWSVKKVMVASLAAVMVLGMGTFAASKVSGYVSSTSTKAYYTSMPSAQQVKKDFGYAPKLVEKFSNGYAFDAAYKGKKSAIGEDGNKMGTNTELTFDYKKGDSLISMDVVNGNHADDTAKLAQDTKEYSGVSVYYNKELYRFVPEGYKMTAQDLEDEKSGKVVFSYGTKKVEEETMSSAIWVDKDGYTYSLTSDDANLSEAELLSMAQEIIADR